MLTASHLARGFALGRTVVGVALLAAPGVARVWVGDVAETAGARVLTRALGVRDLGLGLGVLVTADRGREVLPWLAAGVIADGADLTVTLAAWDRLPLGGRLGVAAAASSGVGAGLALAWLMRSRPPAGAEPAGRSLDAAAEVPRPC